MAPHLTPIQHAKAQTLLQETTLSYTKIAAQIPCSKTTVKTMNANIRCFGQTRAPHNGVGRRRTMTHEMVITLQTHLAARNGLYLDEMADILWEEFRVTVSPSTISRALKRARWSNKVTRRVARERNADLRDEYLNEIAVFQPEHFVFVDESGSDRRDGLRRNGWAPVGHAPTQVSSLQRGERYQILPAITCNGIIWSRVYSGSTDAAMFEDFIAQLLIFCVLQHSQDRPPPTAGLWPVSD